MAIPSIRRLLVPTLLLALVCRAAFGAEDLPTPPIEASKSVQYKRANNQFYGHGDVLKADPEAVILPQTAFAQNGDTYTYTPKKKAPKFLYVEVPNDWIEPITPPDMPASLNIAPDAIQIREPHGDVEVAMPNAPTTFAPAADGQPLPNGAVVKTGANSTAAILFGGVDSARLMPDSEAAVQQAVASTSRAAEVDLTVGGVFSKVGTQVGVQSDYQVHTPYGTALAGGGDFVTYTTTGRVDIWVAQGTVDLLQPDGKKFGTATGDGTGPLKLIRYPAITNPDRALQVDSESLTTILNFIPMANQKLAALHQKAAAGVPLTVAEHTYMARIEQVPALIKLEFVAQPPSQLTILADGTVGFQGTPLSLIELNAKLKEFVADTYDPSVVVMAGTGATYANFQAALKACKDAGVPLVTEEGPLPHPPPPPPAPPKPLNAVVQADGTIKLNGAMMKLDDFTAKIKAAMAATPDLPVTVHPDPKVSYVTLAAIIDACKSAPAKNFDVAFPPLKELTVAVHGDGTIRFHGATMTIDVFSADIKAAIGLRPDLPIVLHSNPKMDYAKFEAVVDACNATGAKQVTIVQPAPQPAPPPKPAPAIAAAPAPPVLPPTAETPPIPTAVPAPKPVAPPQPLTVIAHGDGSIKFEGKTMKIDEFTAKIKNAATANPALAVIIHSNPKMDYAKFEAVVDACKNAPAKEVDVVPPAPQPPPAPAVASTPPTPATPIAPAAPPAPLKPLTVLVHDDGSIGFEGKRGTLDDFKTKVAAMVAATPTRELVIKTSGPKVAYDHVKAVLDACAAANVAHVTAPPPPPAPLPLPVTAETPPTPVPPKPAPAPVNTKAVPAEIDLAADESLKLDGEAVTEDELKTKLAEIKATNPKNPLVMMKQPGVTKDEWKHYVDLCHSMGLKLLVKNAKAPALAPIAVTPPILRPSAAEGGSTVETTPTPAPEETTPTPSAPGTISASEEAVPVEIELTPDGQVSFLGEAVSDADLKARLASVAQSNSREPVLIVKDEKVSRDQLQHVVDLCHAAKLKVKVKTVKSSDMGSLKPHALLPVALEPPPAAGTDAEKVLPVEIGLATKGRLTFEGAPVSLDELKARLATVAKGDPDQPVVIMKEADVPDDSVDALVTVCQGVSSQLKISVKDAPTFTPPSLPDNSPAANLPAPDVHLHASLDALDGDRSTSSR